MADAANSVMTFSFEKLNAYSCARDLVKEIYELQRQFPKEEVYALGSQVRRAAVSITANIAEGCGRGSSKEKVHFIEMTEEAIDNIRPRFTELAKIISGLRKSYSESV